LPIFSPKEQFRFVSLNMIYQRKQPFDEREKLSNFM